MASLIEPQRITSPSFKLDTNTTSTQSEKDKPALMLSPSTNTVLPPSAPPSIITTDPNNILKSAKNPEKICTLSTFHGRELTSQALEPLIIDVFNNSHWYQLTARTIKKELEIIIDKIKANAPDLNDSLKNLSDRIAKVNYPLGSKLNNGLKLINDFLKKLSN
ncbi:MAG: hypothetical protein WC860_09700 [Candidatus Margulisiibacteriota bacterium]|jgi:hypothetical protein